MLKHFFIRILLIFCHSLLLQLLIFIAYIFERGLWLWWTNWHFPDLFKVFRFFSIQFSSKVETIWFCSGVRQYEGNLFHPQIFQPFCYWLQRFIINNSFRKIRAINSFYLKWMVLAQNNWNKQTWGLFRLYQLPVINSDNLAFNDSKWAELAVLSNSYDKNDLQDIYF